jgi:hypothetical protein
MPTNPKSPAESWLNRNFPQQHALCAEIRTDLRSHTPIPVDVTDKSFLGNLMEYAIGLSLCDRPPYLDRFRLLGEDRAARLLGRAGYQTDGTADRNSWWRVALTPAPAGMFLAAYRLAQVNEFLNQRWGGRPDPEMVARILERHPYALPRHGSETNFERLAFDDLWTSYTGGFCAALRSYGTATAQVPLLDGLRQADFFIGTTILEIKSGRLDQDLYLVQLINQMISYSLLAHFDGHPVTHIAAYAIRYQRLLRFRIEPFRTRLAGRRLDMDKASAEFASVLQDPSYRTAA